MQTRGLMRTGSDLVCRASSRSSSTVQVVTAVGCPFFCNYVHCSDDDDDEDETAELMRELERIKKERAEEAARVEAQKRALEEKQAKDAALAGNPLIASALAGKPASASGGVIKRRCVVCVFVFVSWLGLAWHGCWGRVAPTRVLLAHTRTHIHGCR